MDKKPAKRKRTTRAQLEDRLSIPLSTESTFEAIFQVDSDAKPVDQVARQKARDRAGD